MTFRITQLRILARGTIGSKRRPLAALSEVLLEIATYGQVPPELEVKVNERVEVSIKQRYGGMDVATFDAEEQRWLISPKAVRLINSAYQNRDAGPARRMLQSKKVWEDDMDTIDGVMHADVKLGLDFGEGVMDG